MSNRKGFTLLEMSIVLLVISVLLGGGLLIFDKALNQRQVDETKMKMDKIKETLLHYRLAFNRLPCPADATVQMDATSNNYYGVEAQNKGVCDGTPAANFSVASSSVTGDTVNNSAVISSISSTTSLAVGTLVSGTGIPAGARIISIDSSSQITISADATATGSGVTISYNTVAGGMVPVKALKLSDDYAIDGWGRRIMYMVDVNLTTDGAFSHVPVDDSSVNRIKIKDPALNDKENSAIYLLLSYGENGHGSYNRSGSSSRFVNYSGDSDELTNCKCNSSATATTFTASFVQKPLTDDGFDDILFYSTRSDLRASYE
ncbi:MAG: prepilin-type N-terminal cleavage/methylation domain-containing protein [Rickettsiales bacterium]